MKPAAGNRNLRAARAAKNDEFYTQRADIDTAAAKAFTAPWN